MSVCLERAQTGNISLEFGVGNFYENLSRNSKCDSNRAQMSVAVHAEFVRFIVVAGDIKPL